MSLFISEVADRTGNAAVCVGSFFPSASRDETVVCAGNTGLSSVAFTPYKASELLSDPRSVARSVRLVNTRLPKCEEVVKFDVQVDV